METTEKKSNKKIIQKKINKTEKQKSIAIVGENCEKLQDGAVVATVVVVVTIFGQLVFSGFNGRSFKTIHQRRFPMPKRWTIRQ